MEFYDVLKKRRSIRAYKPDAIPEDSITRIMEAVRQAPSACNRQPFQLLLVKDAALRAKISAVYSRGFLAQAPVIAVMLCNDDEAWHRLEGNSAADIDASIAMEHFVLAAAAEGLGTCWVCAFSRPELNKILDLDGSYTSFAISPLGYAAEEPRAFMRKPTEELIKIIE